MTEPCMPETLMIWLGRGVLLLSSSAYRSPLLNKDLFESDISKPKSTLSLTVKVEEDIEEMRAEERAQQAEASISMRELLCSPTLRAPLLIGVVMQLSQQLSGINAVSFGILNYSLYIYSKLRCHDQILRNVVFSSDRCFTILPRCSPPRASQTSLQSLRPWESAPSWSAWLLSPCLSWTAQDAEPFISTALEECSSSQFSSPFHSL